jgi:hypothetical protein
MPSVHDCVGDTALISLNGRLDKLSECRQRGHKPCCHASNLTRQMYAYSYMYMWLSKPVYRVPCIELVCYTIPLRCGSGYPQSSTRFSSTSPTVVAARNPLPFSTNPWNSILHPSRSPFLIKFARDLFDHSNPDTDRMPNNLLNPQTKAPL